MTTKNGIITSGTASLTNKNANKNYIIFRNIFIDPIERPFNIFFINLKTNKVLKKEQFLTNRTNIIEIDNDLIHSEIFLLQAII